MTEALVAGPVKAERLHWVCVHRDAVAAQALHRVVGGAGVGHDDEVGLALTNNKTHYYKVRAYHTEKGTKVYGAWSAVVSARP